MAEYTVAAANTWEQKFVTVVGGLITAGTWNLTNGQGLAVDWALATGSSLQTSTGAWQTGNFRATSNQVNCLDTVGNIFAITGVQLEAGTIATPFERRDYGRELMMCQRYYEKIVVGNGGAYSAGGVMVSNQARTLLQFAVPKRTTPSMGSSAASTFSIQNNNVNTTPSSISYAGTTSVVSSYVFAFATLTLNHPCVLQDGGSSNSYFEASSEL